MLQAIAATLLALAPGLSSQDYGGDPLTRLFDNAGAARHGSEKAATAGRTLFVGKARLYGEPATFRLLAQELVAGSTSFLLEIDGKLSQRIAVDGNSGWTIDTTGASWPLELDDLAQWRAIFLVISGGWCAPSHRASIEPVGDLEGDSPSITLRWHVDGATHATIEISRSSFVPLRVAFDGTSDDARVELGQWVELGGSLWPTRVSIGSGSGIDYQLDFDSAGPAPHYLVDPLTLRGGEPTNVRFDARGTSAVASKRTATGHVLVQTRVGDRAPAWFILDSGAGALVLAKHVVADLRLESLGSRSAVGAGGPVATRFVRAPDITVGPLTMIAPLCAELDLAALQSMIGEPLAGILGADLFRRAVVELDTRAPRVELHEPARYELKRGSATPIQFSNRHSCVIARIEGDRSGLMKLDTGSAADVLFHTSAVERWNLLKGRETTETTLAGVGGTQVGRVGTLGWLEVGGKRFEDVSAIFALASEGALADGATAGILGGEVLGAFEIIFDYPRRRIAFVERGNASK